MTSTLIALSIVILGACTQKNPNAGKPVKSVNPNDIQVMVLGTYHFANPGQDIANVKSDDVLTPTRQAELARTANALATYKPTLIVVERQTQAPEYIDTHYTNFSKQDLLEKKDERVQIAYRLANQLGLKQVYGIDEQPDEGEPDYFPFGKLMEHAKATGQEDILNKDIADVQSQAKTFGDSQKQKSIAELLISSNGEDLTAAAFYYTMFKYDRGEAQPGAELQSYWFMRNAKIFGKLYQLAKPGDRVLVVYGGGHKYWLSHFAEQTPGYVSVDPIPYLQKAIGNVDAKK